MKRYLLTIHAGHNSSVCIGDSSGLLFAMQEERLNGEKNYWGLPKRSVQACLDAVNAKASDLASVSYASNMVLCRYHSREDVIEAYRRQSTFTGKLRQRVAMPLMVALNPNFGQDKLVKFLAEAGLGDIPLNYFDHHLCHAATAYYGLRANPSEPYLVLTCDGAGDSLCATVRTWGGGQMREIAKTSWENSLGALYAWVTFGMGFVPLEHEYKLMGMAPYASESAAIETAKVFHRYLGLDASGLSFKRTGIRRTSDIHEALFADLKGVRFDYICAGLQRFTEDLLCEWTASAIKATGIRKVLAAGGVFMNVKANKRIAEMAEVDVFEAFPSCGDETLPFGAYYLQAAAKYGDAEVKPLQHFYLGDQSSDAETVAALASSGYRHEKPANIATAVADLLAAGQPVARCAGRMEFGARALGNRSILADPSNLDVVRVINQMVKKRDFWMPFAPMMLEEHANDYIQNPKGLASPYMMMTFDAKANFRELIAAVHNADLTCRAQILKPGQNDDMRAIIQAFKAKTNRGVVLNTSFNLHGYPIVRTTADALHVFKSSGLEHLQVGNWLVHKQ